MEECKECGKKLTTSKEGCRCNVKQIYSDKEITKLRKDYEFALKKLNEYSSHKDITIEQRFKNGIIKFLVFKKGIFWRKILISNREIKVHKARDD